MMQTPISASAVFALLSFVLGAQCTVLPVPGQQHKAAFKGAEDSSSAYGREAAGGAARSAPASFILGASDVIRVSVWKEPELSQTAVVRPDGKISIPLVGEVPVAGSDVLQAQATIAARLRSLLANPQVTLSVLEIHSRQVYITGEIGHAGAYPLTSSMTVLQLIASAGGLSEYAHKKGIYILRSNVARPIPFNYQNVVRGKGPGGNLELVPGDTVVVP
jgi:polysaccharide export outer membrane protein